MIVRQHSARRTDEQQTFLHIVRQNPELFLLTVQFIHLRGNLRLERGDLSCERFQLRILYQCRFRVNAERFELQTDCAGELITEQIYRYDQDDADDDCDRQDLQHQPEVVFRREQQRIHQQGQRKRDAHNHQQLAEYVFLHSVPSVDSIEFASKR